MEIKKGYKMTDVGVIPEDWEVKSIGEIAKTTSGGTPSREDDSLYIGKNRWFTTSELNDGYIYDSIEHISDEAIKITTARIVPANSILMAMYGATIGKLAIITKESSTNQACCAIMVNSDIVMKYVFYNLLFLRQNIIELGVGAGQPNISQSIVRSIHISIPSKKEQQAIADALTKVDNLIMSLSKVIEKKKLIKKGAMQKLLSGEMRLDGFDVEWERKQIGKIGITYSGITGKNKSDFGHGTAKYITFLNVLNNPIINTKELELVDISSNENQNKAVKGDLFFNVSSETPEEVGICSVLLDDISNFYVNSFCFGFRITDKEVSGIYLSYLFRTSLGRDKMSSIAQGATRYNLSKDYFNEIELTIPPTKAEQTAIANILTTMDNEIEALEKERDKYKCIKQGMMQQLLTGKIRLTCQ